MIQLQQVGLQRGVKPLLEQADLTVFPGQKWGIIGANGAGKSSLFKVFLKELSFDSGSASWPNGWRIAHMAQEVEASDRTAVDYVLDGDDALRQIERAIDGETDGERLAHLYGDLEAIDGYTAPARAGALLAGLGFKPGDDGRAVADFSGGWRIRLNLARALMARADLLLLDEPTNHLDLDATLWLEGFLQKYPGTLLIISHDRDFLDGVANGIISFENAKLIQYSGNYSSFERQKAERITQQQLAFEKQQVRIAHIADFVRRFRAKASKAKQAQSRLKELDRMQALSPAHIDSPFNFEFFAPEKLPQQLLNLSEVEIGYGDKSILQKVSLTLMASSRIGLLGANGAGKSTLLKVLAGKVEPLAGSRSETQHLNLAYFNQHQLEALDLNASCALHIQRLSPKAREQEIRNFLGGFDFRGDRAFEPITHFSGGEKARLALALLVWQKPNLLLLDEPTNHLDLEMRHALEVALQSYEGALVLVSHDRHLLKQAVDEFWLVGNGRAAVFDGDLTDYEALLKRPAPKPAAAAPTVAALRPAANLKPRPAANLKPLQAAIAKLERKLEQVSADLSRVEQQLMAPELYSGVNSELEPLQRRQQSLRQELEALEADWLEKSTELESKTSPP